MSVDSKAWLHFTEPGAMGECVAFAADLLDGFATARVQGAMQNATTNTDLVAPQAAGDSFAKRKAAQSLYGSPMRYLIDQMVPVAIARECPKEAKMLDIGCGAGRYALYFIDAGVRGEYVGMDIDTQKWTDENLPEGFSRRFVQFDAHKLGDWPEQVDFAVSLTAYEHFEDDLAVSKGLAKVLKPGGKAIIVVPSHWSYALYGEHGFRRYSAGSIRRQMAEAGLEVVRIEKIGGAFSWLFHFLWFFPAHATRMVGKTLIFGVHGMNKDKARANFPRLLSFLDNLGSYHLRTAFGRALHKMGILTTTALDKALPIMEVGYIAVVRRP
ncbi:class I SAM-dependent methyltransferase [bacterium]|nr:class I SAM-dependent methyltransferase [bacterium]MCB9478139.1 class I SAM-dependent methyltransferase [Deltaproteobacteria bacterium]